MTEAKDVKPFKNEGSENSEDASGRSAIEFDVAEFMHFLADTDWDDAQKAEYITLVWSIVCDFVALGFDVHPLQQARKNSGKPRELQAQPPPEARHMIDSSHSRLIEKFVREGGMETASAEGGVIDG